MPFLSHLLLSVFNREARSIPLSALFRCFVHYTNWVQKVAEFGRGSLTFYWLQGRKLLILFFTVMQGVPLRNAYVNLE